TRRPNARRGRTKAWDMGVTGGQVEAEEAEVDGLVGAVLAAAGLLERTLEAARGIAGKSLPAAMMIKECVNRAEEIGLAEGVRFERRLFHSLFASHDQKEGMQAFVAKRAPNFRHH
ncbi:enoyl-CoA hydratase-related protein, partial [Pseudomonas aeruginosa]